MLCFSEDVQNVSDLFSCQIGQVSPDNAGKAFLELAKEKENRMVLNAAFFVASVYFKE